MLNFVYSLAIKFNPDERTPDMDKRYDKCFAVDVSPIAEGKVPSLLKA